MRKILLLALVICMTLSFAVPAYAALPEDTVISPQYVYIKSTSVGLSIDKDTGVASCTSYCNSIDGYTVEIEYKLQRYVAASWTTIKVWNESGSGFANLSKTADVYSGYTYRGYVTFRIRNSAGTLLETGTSSKTYVYPTQ